MARTIRAALAALALMLSASCSQQQPGAASAAPPIAQPIEAEHFTPEQQADIRAIVQDYLTRDPAVMQAALDALAEHKESERRRELETDPRSFSVGPADADIVVVEFFDYRCPHCVRAIDWVFKAMRAHPEARFVFRELPILTQQSAEASRAAIASMRQGRYLPFHRALMRHPGALDSAAIDALAREHRIDVARMRRDMADPAIEEIINRNYEIASEAGVNFTPAFMINGVWVNGYRDDAQMDRAFADATRPAQR
jgi:protein-disulfide isomerase